MAKKEISYSELEIGRILQVKSKFEYNFKKYEKNERVTVRVLGDESHTVTILKDNKEQKFTMSEINQWFRKPKGKNRVMNSIAKHDDVKLVIRNNRAIIVILNTDFKGMAYCDEQSEWNPDAGYMIAYYKAKKKENNYIYRVDRNGYRATIKAAQKMLRNIESTHVKMQKQYDYFINKAMNDIKVKPPLPSPF